MRTSTRAASVAMPLVILAAVVVAFSVEAQKPVEIQAAERRFNEAYRQGDWATALEVGHELAVLRPGDAVVEYNLACVYALDGDAAAALHWLGKASDHGFKSLDHLDTDSDLDAVRDLAGFARVRARVEANRERRRAELRASAAETPVLIVTPKGSDPRRPAPVIVVLHGYGDRPDPYPRLWRGLAGDLGAILAVPRGGRRVGGGYGWSGVEEAEAAFERTITRVSEDRAVDRERVVLIGFSQGGFLAMALGLRHPDLVAGVVVIAGAYIPEIDRPAPAGGLEPRYYFMAGSRDKAVTDMQRAADDFKGAGYEVTLRIVPGIGHELPNPPGREIGNALRWVLRR